MFLFDTLTGLAILAYVLITAISIACSPKKDLTPARRSDLMLIVGGSLLAYISGSIWVFLLGWILTTLPFRSSRAGVVLMASNAILAIGAAIPAFAQGHNAQMAAFGAIALAAVLRKGIFPFHFWVPLAFEDSPIPAVNLLLNSHLGAFVVIRFGFAMYPQAAGETLAYVSTLAIFTALYTAFLAIVATRPRRILALLCISQASFLFAGFENRNLEGIAGALLHWVVVSFATTSLLAVYGTLEARSSEVQSPRNFLGLGFHAPRLGVFFAVAALSLVGLPGTLGFVAEDLLFHGSLESHPLLGIGLPVATALNAITALRLVATLFWGRRGTEIPPIPDARPRERWALTVPVLVLIGGGLIPGVLIKMGASNASAIAGYLSGR